MQYISVSHGLRAILGISLVLGGSRDHIYLHNTCYESSGRVIGPSQRPVPGKTQHSQDFEPAIPTTKRPQTDALDRVATGIGVTQLFLIEGIPLCY